MDASDVLRKKLARMYASVANSPQATITKGQVPNNPPLTPDQIATIKSQYPASDFAFANNIYPCGTSTICSTIYTAKYYYNNTN
jgi:hypothetical protein